MAVNLNPALDGRFEFGDMAGVAGQTTLSFALIFKPTVTIVDGNRLFSQWGGSPNFISLITDSDELGFAVSDLSFNIFGQKTTDLNMVSGTTYRIVMTVTYGSPPVMHIYVNGVDKSLVAFLGSNNLTQSVDSTSIVTVGHEPGGNHGVEGDYAEFAIWQRVLTPTQANEFTVNNKYPYCCGPTGLLYLSMTDTTTLTDQWGGVIASLTAGSNATHPSMSPCGTDNPFFTTVGAKRFGF